MTFPGGAVLAMCFYAGYLNLTIYAVSALFLFSFLICYQEHSKNKNLWDNTKPILFVFSICIIGFLLAAPQNLPVLEYSRSSIRHGIQDFNSLTNLGSIPPLQLISFLAPQIYGATEIPQWITGQVYAGYWEIAYYIGIFPLILSLVAVLFRKDRTTTFFSLLFISAIFISLGRNAAPASWLYILPIPLFTRIPSRFSFFFDFSIAILAALGLDYLLKNRKEKKLIFFSKYLASAAFLAITVTIIFYFKTPFNGQDASTIKLINAFKAIVKLSIALTISYIFLNLIMKRPTGKITPCLAIIFIMTDLFHFTYTLNPVIKSFLIPEKEFHQKPAINILKNDNTIFRTSGFSYPRWLGHINKLYNLGYVGGFSHKDFTLFRGLNDKMGHGGHSWFDLKPDPDSSLIDFYNIKYLISKDDLSKKSDKYVKVQDTNKKMLFENKKAFPRAFMVGKYIVEKDREKILNLMEITDLRKTVILEKEINAVETEGGTANIISYEPTNINIQVKGDGGMLVLSDLYYTGWKAYIDGVEAEIYRANYTFRAVRIPQGKHSIVFSYNPQSFYLGVIIGSVTFIGLCFVYLTHKRS
jgi:hypothetical protein